MRQPASRRAWEPGITVLTPSIRSREHLLVEAQASVRGQTVVPPPRHLVTIDRLQRGPAAMRNSMLRRTTTEWVAFLDDDDLMDPEHLELLLAKAEATGADVVSSWWRWMPPDGPFAAPRPDAFDAARLERENYIPITVLARTRAVLESGAFDRHDRYEDWALWLRMLDRGCKFAIVPRVTWSYRLGSEGRTARAPHTWKQRWRYVKDRLGR
jgi:hypothetical protein